jgi:hypothetical protein
MGLILMDSNPNFIIRFYFVGDVTLLSVEKQLQAYYINGNARREINLEFRY